jgi:hypothetical protein
VQLFGVARVPVVDFDARGHQHLMGPAAYAIRVAEKWRAAGAASSLVWLA